MIRRPLAAALALALAGSLAGCAPLVELIRGSAAGSATESTPTMEQVDVELEPYYHQVLEWSSCESDFQCATATAPLDWSDPGGETIELALIRQPATSGSAQGSLFVNPGGPGGSGYDFIRDSLDYAVGEPLQAAFDVIGFDPRGVGRSSAVSCATDPSELDAYYYGITPGEVGSDAWIDAAMATASDWAAACEANTGALLGNVDTASAARDLDMLRAAAGDETLTYFGYSYGTFLGSVYAELFPEKTGRLALDGAVDPTASDVDVTVFQARGFESAFRAYVADCLTSADCPFAGLTVDDAADFVSYLFDELDASPIEAADGRELGSDTLFTAIVFPLYNEANWPYLDALFSDVASGSAEVAFILADAYYSRNEDGTYSDNSTEAFLAVNCLDYPGEPTVAEMKADARAITERAPLFGAQMAWGFSCSDWPYAPVGNRSAITAPGSADILVIGTTNDPATPYDNAVALADMLENGHLVTFEGEGHTAYPQGDSCITETVNDYLLDGVVPASDPMC